MRRAKSNQRQLNEPFRKHIASFLSASPHSKMGTGKNGRYGDEVKKLREKPVQKIGEHSELTHQNSPKRHFLRKSGE